MTEPSALGSLPDRSMKQSEVERIGESETVEWVETLRTGTGDRRKMVNAWVLQAKGIGHVLLYELDGWVSQGSFEADGLDDREKVEQAEEILDF